MRAAMVYVKKLGGTAFMASLLLGCGLSVALGAGPELASGTRQVMLSSYALSFELPLLPVSKDFPAPLVKREIDLSSIGKGALVLEGHWEGSQESRLIANGLLQLWVDVSPWPEDVASAPNCQEKARSAIQRAPISRDASDRAPMYSRKRLRVEMQLAFADCMKARPTDMSFH
jgi:hypothetical protein